MIYRIVFRTCEATYVNVYRTIMLFYWNTPRPLQTLFASYLLHMNLHITSLPLHEKIVAICKSYKIWFTFSNLHIAVITNFKLFTKFLRLDELDQQRYSNCKISSFGIPNCAVCMLLFSLRHWKYHAS